MFTGNEWKGILSPSIDGINVRQAEMVCVGHVAPIPLKRIHGSAGDHPRRKESCEKDLHLQGLDPPRPHYHGTVDLPNDYSVTAPEIPTQRADGSRASSAETPPTTISTARTPAARSRCYTQRGKP